MASPFEIADARRQIRPEQPGGGDIVGKRRVVMRLTMFATKSVLSIFRYMNDLRRNFDLLRDFRGFRGR